MNIVYPYLPAGRKIDYVPANNRFMKIATDNLAKSGCKKQATSAVVVKDNKVIGMGTNAGIRVDVCPRDAEGYKTGEGYHLCKEVCHQGGHSEVMSINDAVSHGFDTHGADVYLDGHWWCCKDCWDKMIGAGINKVYLRDDSYTLYRK